MSEQLLSLLAGRRGHFRMESGYHSDQWFNLDRLFDSPERLQPFVDELARRLAAHGIDSVCGPESGGAKLATMIGATLRIDRYSTKRLAPEETSGLFQVRYVVPANQRERLRDRKVAIVDDAISAGSAVRGTHADLLACGARPVALGALIVFGNAAAQFAADRGLALEGLAPATLDMWLPQDCPLCRAGSPAEEVSDAP